MGRHAVGKKLHNPSAHSVLAAPGARAFDEGERRSAVARIEAYVDHDVYGLTRDEIEYIMGAFPIVEAREIEAFGEYPMKRRVLEAYDALAS